MDFVGVEDLMKEYTTMRMVKLNALEFLVQEIKMLVEFARNQVVLSGPIGIALERKVFKAVPSLVNAVQTNPALRKLTTHL